MNKIWIDAGHGGNDSGATCYGRGEKADNLTYALELGRQFEAQGMAAVMTRSTDIAITLNDRTAIERSEKCNLAIACHRNGATDREARGFEIWLHSVAPQSYVNWAANICKGVEALGMPLRRGQNINGKPVKGVYRGFRTDPKANYYANSGTSSPSMLIEFGFVSNKEDNAFFDEHYKQVCAAIVKASCEFLGVPYATEDKQTNSKEIAELQGENARLNSLIDEMKQILKEA